MTQDYRLTAKSMMKSFMSMMAEYAGLCWSGDNEAEIDAMVDAMISAAVNEACEHTDALARAHSQPAAEQPEEWYDAQLDEVEDMLNAAEESCHPKDAERLVQLAEAKMQLIQLRQQVQHG